MTIRDLQDEIIRLKKEKNICILAHAYQGQDIWEVADYIGDSFGLSQKPPRCRQIPLSCVVSVLWRKP